MSKIEIKNLSFEYDKQNKVLDDLTLNIEEGQIVAILGKNGCGKSTLLDCIIGFNKIPDNTILIDNIDINSLSKTNLSRKMAFISQNTTINIDYTVKEFISFGRTPYLSFNGSLTKEDEELIISCADKCDIKNILDKSITKISGGERQLAYIARSLVQNTPIIIMDEPTASLDFGNQQRLFKTIKELNSSGKTIVFTTHNPHHVLNLDCDVVVIKDNKIYITGKASEIINNDNIKAIYGDDIIL